VGLAQLREAADIAQEARLPSRCISNPDIADRAPLLSLVQPLGGQMLGEDDVCAVRIETRHAPGGRSSANPSQSEAGVSGYAKGRSAREHGFVKRRVCQGEREVGPPQREQRGLRGRGGLPGGGEFGEPSTATAWMMALFPWKWLQSAGWLYSMASASGRW
jgi:hypothetical protein